MAVRRLETGYDTVRMWEWEPLGANTVGDAVAGLVGPAWVEVTGVWGGAMVQILGGLLHASNALHILLDSQPVRIDVPPTVAVRVLGGTEQTTLTVRLSASR